MLTIIRFCTWSCTHTDGNTERIRESDSAESNWVYSHMHILHPLHGVVTTDHVANVLSCRLGALSGAVHGRAQTDRQSVHEQYTADWTSE